jgi:hypothetical protein
MSPPIFTPDGSEVSEIVLPDGSTASEVIGPDGNVVFEAGAYIPDSDVYLPMDEGSKTTLNDGHNNADGTLASDSWESDSAFNGGTAPKETTADLTPPQGSSLTVVLRAEANGNMGGTGTNSFYDFGGRGRDPSVEWNDNVSAWRLSDVSVVGRCEVSETASSLNGQKRIIVGRYSSNESELDVYDNSLSLIGSDTANGGDVTYDDTTMTLGRGNWDNFDQLYYKLDYLTDSELTDLLNEFYVEAGAYIPDSDVYLPMDEGSKTTLNDGHNNADGTLASDSWESDSAFNGGTAPKETTADLTPPQGSSLTVVLRAEANGNMGGTGTNSFYDFGGRGRDPSVEWNDNVSAWRLSDVSVVGRCEVSETASSLNGQKRIIVGRYSSNESELDVYDNSLSLIGSDTANGGDVTYDDTTMTLGRGNWDNFDQLYYKLDYLTDSELTDLLNEFYA